MMRSSVAALAVALLLVGAGGARAGKAGKVPCKDIRAAMAGGKTAAQVASELGTRVKRVENCMSGKKKGKKGAEGGGAAAGEEE
jgi:hypothetical protein